MISNEEELAAQLEILYPMEPGEGEKLVKWLVTQGVTLTPEPSVGVALVGTYVRTSAALDTAFLPYGLRKGGAVVRDADGKTFTMRQDETHGKGPTTWEASGRGHVFRSREMAYPVQVLWSPAGGGYMSATPVSKWGATTVPVTGPVIISGSSTISSPLTAAETAKLHGEIYKRINRL